MDIEDLKQRVECLQEEKIEVSSAAYSSTKSEELRDFVRSQEKEHDEALRFVASKRIG